MRWKLHPVCCAWLELDDPSTSTSSSTLLDVGWRQRYRHFVCAYALGRHPGGWRSKPHRSQAFELGMLLLTASVAKTLSESGTRNLDSASIPLSETLVLRVLERSSLDISKKMDFFTWCSQRPDYKHSAATYSQMFRILCHSRNRRPLCGHEVRDLMGSMKRDGIILGPSTFQLLLDAFIQSGKFHHAIEILDQMEEVGASLNLQIYNSVVVALARKNQLALALSMFTKLLDASAGNVCGVAPASSLACNVLLVALRRAGMRKEFTDVFCKLREKMAVLDRRGYNICIHAFGCWGDLQTALHLFKEMKDVSSISDSSTGPDLCTYNSLIHALCLVGKARDALAVVEELKGSGHEPDAFTYRLIIQGCSKSYRIEDATKLFNEMRLNGFHPDTTVYNSLLDGFLKARKLTEACQLFEKMIQDGIRASCCTYNILIDGLIKNGRAVAGYTLFCDLKKKGQFVDAVTYSIVVLHLCREGQFEESLHLVEEMEARGFVVDLVTMTALVMELYKQGRWGSLERLMKHIRDGNLLPDVLKWKAGVEAFLENPQGKRRDFTSLFPRNGDLKNLVSSMDLQSDSYSGSGCAKNPDVEIQSCKADEWSLSPYLNQLADQVESNNHIFPWFSLSGGKRVRGDGMHTFDIDMVNTYLSIFLAQGNLSLACKLFEIFTDEGVGAVSYTYNSIASSFMKKGYFDEAWGVLQDMSDKLCPADIATYNVIVQNLGKMGRADIANSVLDRLMEDGGYLDVVMYNTLINALGKTGRVDEAQKLFEQMKNSGLNPDIVTFNTLIEVHAKADDECLIAYRLEGSPKFEDYS
ncbi:hypothetical protein Dimus_012431 [Dionaea muscipula]